MAGNSYLIRKRWSKKSKHSHCLFQYCAYITSSNTSYYFLFHSLVQEQINLFWMWPKTAWGMPLLSIECSKKLIDYCVRSRPWWTYDYKQLYLQGFTLMYPTTTYIFLLHIKFDFSFIVSLSNNFRFVCTIFG